MTTTPGCATSAVFVSQLGSAALRTATLMLIDDNREAAAASMLRSRLASSLATAHDMEFSRPSEDIVIPNLIESIRRARSYAEQTGMATEVVAHADDVLNRL